MLRFIIHNYGTFFTEHPSEQRKDCMISTAMSSGYRQQGCRSGLQGLGKVNLPEIRKEEDTRPRSNKKEREREGELR